MASLGIKHFAASSLLTVRDQQQNQAQEKKTEKSSRKRNRKKIQEGLDKVNSVQG